MKEEILPINLLRFFAALSVVFVHKFSLFVEKGYFPKSFGFLNHFAEHGYLGVNLFFLISGFVITLSSEGRTFRQFVSARFIRLFPVFWMCVSITTLLVILFGVNEHISLRQYFANLTMVPGLFGSIPFIDGSYWTLEYELRFYAIIAAVLLLKRFITIPLQGLALVATPPLLYETLFYRPTLTSFVNGFLGAIFHTYLAGYGQYFIAGILFYGIYRNSKSYYHYVAIFICYVVAILKAFANSYPSNSLLIIAFCVTAIFIIFLLISLKKITNDSFIFLGPSYKKILVTLGAMTYPLYLLHSRIIDLVLGVFDKHGIFPQTAFFIVVFVVGLLVFMVNKMDIAVRAWWRR